VEAHEEGIEDGVSMSVESLQDERGRQGKVAFRSCESCVRK
jgi:hypothetical protein